MTVNDLPAVNATLNGISAVLLVVGYTLIRQRRIEQHRCDVSAIRIEEPVLDVEIALGARSLSNLKCK